MMCVEMPSLALEGWQEQELRAGRECGWRRGPALQWSYSLQRALAVHQLQWQNSCKRQENQGLREGMCTEPKPGWALRVTAASTALPGLPQPAAPPQAGNSSKDNHRGGTRGSFRTKVLCGSLELCQWDTVHVVPQKNTAEMSKHDVA